MSKSVYVNGLKIGGVDENINNNINNKEQLEELWSLLFKMIKRDDIDAMESDEECKSIIEDYEKSWNIKIPEELKIISSWKNVGSAIFNVFPTNNCFIVPGKIVWSDETYGRQWKLVKNPCCGEEYMIRIIDENQGCCYWYAGWKKNDKTCRVYVSDNVLPEIDDNQSIDNQNIDNQSIDNQDNDSDHDYDYENDIYLTGSSLTDFLIDYSKRGIQWYKDVGWFKDDE